MDDHHHHDHLIDALAKDYQGILENSEQGIYIYLDDTHKICNKNFATLLGYASEDEWAKVDMAFPDAFVAEESQDTLISSFQDAMEKNIGSVNDIVWKKKDGSAVSAHVILVPIAHNGHFFALHFVMSN